MYCHCRDEDEYRDDTGAYLMIRNIGYLFRDMGDFSCNKTKKLFQLWNLKESVIKKRIKVINKCLDVYDIIIPYNHRKPILSKTDLEGVYKLMDRLFYDTGYTYIDENGVDLNMELGSPGWFDLKKVLLRFFSKIKINREFKKFEEEVEGTGHVRPLYRKDGTSLKAAGTRGKVIDTRGTGISLKAIDTRAAGTRGKVIDTRGTGIFAVNLANDDKKDL